MCTFCGLQLASLWRDRAARRKYKKAVGQPKHGAWSFSRSRYSPAVYEMDERDPRPLLHEAQPELNEELAFLGQGKGASVT